MITITPEMRAAIEQAGDQPPKLVDLVTNTSYVLIKEEAYRKIQAAADGIRADPVPDLYPLIDEVFGQAGWDDPRMNDYDRYEEHRP